MNEEEIDDRCEASLHSPHQPLVDERDTLSDSHRDYMARYVQFEILRLERTSASFRKRLAMHYAQRLKARLRGL
jgi:hypothetical protein